jgi:crotonobetainyl-CoA:carnitine CoA-transferase CaiB-like acyl-CoA transferase
VQDLGEVAADPQTEAIGILARLGSYTTLGPAFSADGERPQYASAPPALGEHTSDVLAEVGYSAGEIADLAGADIIRLA